jgi:hypothetical protein
MFKVIIVKPVTDYLRAIVEVEADNEEDAEGKAADIAETEGLFQFWQCGDTLEETTYETEQIVQAMIEENQ